MKFQGDILNFCDFIQVFVFTTNHHLKITPSIMHDLPVIGGLVLHLQSQL